MPHNTAVCVRESFLEEKVLEAVVSTEGDFCPPRDIGNTWRCFWLSKTNRREGGVLLLTFSE